MSQEIQKQAQKLVISDLKSSLQEMPEDMRCFSLAMRSLYTDKAVGGYDSTVVQFRELRDDTRTDAMLYLKCILPLTTKYVSSVKEYFEYYVALTFDEWCENLSDIKQETTTYKELSHVVLKMYEEMMVTLKKRQVKAKILMTQFKDLEEKYKKEKAKLEAEAASSRSWAIALAFIPFVGAIASPIIGASADLDLAKAIAKGEQADVNKAATLIVAETLIPALAHFINGLTKAAGFFQVMEKELESFEGKAEKSIESPIMLHYKMMNKETDQMKSLCLAFYAVLPAVRTDFLAIPEEDTDKNYVDSWLERQLVEINKSTLPVVKFISKIWK